MTTEPGHRMEQAAESTLAKLLARFGTPILLGLIGWLLVDKLNSTSKKLEGIEQGQNAQAIQVTELRGDVKRVDDKIDSTVLYQVSDLRRRVDQLEQASKVK